MKNNEITLSEVPMLFIGTDENNEISFIWSPDAIYRDWWKI